MRVSPPNYLHFSSIASLNRSLASPCTQVTPVVSWSDFMMVREKSETFVDEGNDFARCSCCKMGEDCWE